MARMREKNVGVVAVEAPIASSEEHREQLNDIFTRAIASDASPEDIEHAELADEQGLCAQVLHELKGTGKRVELIGFTLDSPGLLAAEQMSQDSIRLDSSTLEQQPNDVLRDAAASLVVSMAQSNGPRNNDMAEQLDELSRKYPGTRIGVFASSAHEPVVEMLGVRGHRKIDRVFINANGEEREHEHPNGVLLAQNMQESGLRELTRDELNRVVLEHTLGFKMNELGEASPLSFAGRIVRTMPEERVEELLGVIDEIKANSETRGDAWRSIGQLALMVNTEYTLRQDAADNRHTEQGGGW